MTGPKKSLLCIMTGHFFIFQAFACRLHPLGRLMHSAKQAMLVTYSNVTSHLVRHAVADLKLLIRRIYTVTR